MNVTLGRLALLAILTLPPLSGWAWDKDYRSTYLLGDSDSRLSARRAAILQIQQQAIQEAGVYMQGNSVLHNNELDEKIEQITAAIVQVEVLTEQFVVDGVTGQQRLLLEARATVDESVLADRVRNLQQQNQNSTELKQLASDNQALQQKLELLLQQQQALLPLLQQPAPVRTPALPAPAQGTSPSERAFWGN